mgnify:CR=1 FL=1
MSWLSRSLTSRKQPACANLNLAGPASWASERASAGCSVASGPPAPISYQTAASLRAETRQRCRWRRSAAMAAQASRPASPRWLIEPRFASRALTLRPPSERRAKNMAASKFAPNLRLPPLGAPINLRRPILASTGCGRANGPTGRPRKTGDTHWPTEHAQSSMGRSVTWPAGG